MACRIGDTVYDPPLHVACGYFPDAIEMLLEHGVFEDWPLTNPNLRQDSRARQQSRLEQKQEVRWGIYAKVKNWEACLMTRPSAFLTLRLALRSTMPLLISPLLILIRISLALFIQFFHALGRLRQHMGPNPVGISLLILLRFRS